MFLKSLILKDFRTYESIEIEFNKSLTFFIGPNGIGKTNILEAVYLLGTTKSFRNALDKDLVKWNKENYFVKAEAYSQMREDFDLSIGYSVNGRKNLNIDNSRVHKKRDFFGNIVFIIFSPEDIQLIDGSQALRRRLIDSILSKADKILNKPIAQEKHHRGYLYELGRYNKLLKIRARILKNIKLGIGRVEDLVVWDKLYVQLALWITRSRIDFVEKVQISFSNFFNSISGTVHKVRIQLVSGIGMETVRKGDIKNEQAFLQKLKSIRNKEIRIGYSLLGPHRDEIQFTENGKDIRKFFSHGQKRSLSIALRLMEYEYLKSQGNEIPILLVDDVIAELDIKRKGYFLEILMKSEQALITSTDLKFLELNKEFWNKEYEVLHIKNGEIEKGSIN